MKFELTEIVGLPNPDEVLRVLERHLRTVAGDVVRSERQVTAYGIGPSPRTVNRRDTTVIEASAVDGATALRVSVTYQASALLGNMPQDDIVRSKIEGAIDEARGELKVWKVGVPPPGLDSVEPKTDDAAAEVELPQTLQQPRAFDEQADRWPTAPEQEPSTSKEKEFAPPVNAVEVDLPVAVPEIAKPELEEVSAAASPEQEIAAEHFVGAEIKEGAAEQEVLPDPIAGSAIPPRERSGIRMSAIGRKRARRLAVGQQSRAQQSLINPSGSETAEAGQTKETPRETSPLARSEEAPLRGLTRAESDPPARGRWKTVLVIALILLVAVGGTGYAFRDALPIPEPWKVLAADWSTKLTAEFSNLKTIVSERSSGSTVQVVPVPVAPTTDASSEPVVSDPEVMVKPETNIYLWVQDWGAALRSKDPVAQASYYAETVDRYLSDKAVSHDAVLKSKKDAIDQRSEPWSVQIEHIYVESQSATGMNVRLVKRILSRGATGLMLQQRIRVRLKVVRANGTWKIVEEQELEPPAPPAG